MGLALGDGGEEAGFHAGPLHQHRGMREDNSSFRKSCSPAGGFLISSTRAATCSASRGLATTPSAARSATCLRYVSKHD